MLDPDLHLFLNDKEILTRIHLPRLTQTVRRESNDPVLSPNGGDEGTSIGYACALRDPKTGAYRLWYSCHCDHAVRLAVSRDGRNWEKTGFALLNAPGARVDNQGLVETGSEVDTWFAGSKLVGLSYCTGFADPNIPPGLYLLRSRDGERLEIKYPGILPSVGDRSSLFYDSVNREYLLFSRPGNSKLPGIKDGEPLRSRVAQLWKSADLVHWTDHGVVLKYDDEDPPDTEIYGLQPFRSSRGFIGLMETYHCEMERMDTQLIWSEDGLRWERVGGRHPVLPLGGEGAWDSHWVVPTFNEPIPEGDRLLVFYSGASTKHGSGNRHRRAIGLASIRKDGWVSLEAGRTEGVLVTHPLPLRKPMSLEVNADCLTGYLTAEVIEAKDGCPREAISGYEGESGRVEGVDSVRIPIRWKDRNVVQPVASGACYLRFTLKQASFFSYRWVEA